MFRPVTTRHAAQAPDFEEDVIVRARVRMVYGSIRLIPTAVNAAAVQAQVETAPGSDEYDIVFEDENGPGRKVSTRSFFFGCPAGCRYRFSKLGADPSAVEVVLNYGYTDL